MPITRKNDDGTAVAEATERIRQELTDAGIRVHVDNRENLRPGNKFNHWELRGVPLRFELGPRDVGENVVVAARRDIPGRDGKQSLSQDNLAEQALALLDTI